MRWRSGPPDKPSDYKSPRQSSASLGRVRFLFSPTGKRGRKMGGGRGGGKKHWGRMVSSRHRIQLAAARHPSPWFSRPACRARQSVFLAVRPHGSGGGDFRREGHRNGPRSGSRRARQAGRLNHGWRVLRTRCRWRSKQDATAVELAQVQSHNLTARCATRSRQRAGR